ncbi:MAG TPA: carboxypeptidase regulatory-like domain-containing protein [Alphaproteobacteria bacterium]|nr:carboxypeptidase regulatory-like domain-containing protein [Alphaproteobacteria bacterium]
MLSKNLRFFGLVLAWLGCLLASATAMPVQSTAPETGKLQVTVLDTNGLPVREAVVLVQQEGQTVVSDRTVPSGEILLGKLTPGVYQVTIHRDGFYPATADKVTIQPGQTSQMEVRLEPVREYSEQVDVTAQPSPIDTQQIASSHSIAANDISTIPYPSTRDYRNVLAYIPGVIVDTAGQMHISGSNTQAVQDYLDGFEVSSPVSGALTLRLNPDSLRRIDIQNGRYSAQYGKGSGGLANLEVQDGDNHFRVNATDFFPTFQNVNGWHFNNWTPRGYVSGPLKRDKAWFEFSHEGENDLNIVKELPDGSNTNPVWRTADMARLRMNLGSRHSLTATALLNLFDSIHGGLTPFDPAQVSFNQYTRLYFFAVKDQFSINKDSLLELGVSFQGSGGTFRPQGNLPYIFTPDMRTGNHYMTDDNWADRNQTFSNFYLGPKQKLGTHQITVGGRVDRVIYHDNRARNMIEFVDANNVLLRQIVFQNNPAYSISTLESSAFVQDRWSPFSRMLVEAGGRWDRDSFVQRDMFSPRFGGTFLLQQSSETKLSAGIGTYYDRTSLSLISRSFQGTRTDTFFSPSPSVTTTFFVVDKTQLVMPKFTTWSVSLERRLPARVYGRVDFLSRHGVDGWAYESQPGGNWLLKNDRQDKYDAVQFTLRKEFKRGYPILVAYTRSSARSNQALDLDLDNPISGNQVGGPLGWDAPNHVVSWGSTPLFWKFKKFDLAYSALWRTGFPFVTVDQFGRLVNGPGVFRFPNFFTLNPAIERKFTLRGQRWAARLAINDITNQVNPGFVDNNVNSPGFLNTFGTGHRTFAGRIRWLGRSKQP